MSITHRLIAAATIVAASLASPAAAAGGEDRPDGAYATDASAIAAVERLAVDAVVERLEVEQRLGDVAAALVERLTHDVIAGTVIEHDGPGSHLVVWTTDTAATRDALDALMLPADVESLVHVAVRHHSMSDHLAELARWVQVNPTGDAYVDERRGELVLRESDESFVEVPIADLAVPSRHEPMTSRPAAYLYGGLALSSCTSGFSVYDNLNSQDLGVTTAGHCTNSISRNGTSLPHADEAYFGVYDVQWHRDSTFDVRNWAQDNTAGGSTPYYRVITGKRDANSTVTGQSVCKYGKTTGFDCGEITSMTYRPGYVPNGQPTFGLISGAEDMSTGGDSGGPIYAGSYAVGTTSGERNGTQNIFMPIHYMSWSGGISVVVKTS